jgi:hypothetical protein
MPSMRETISRTQHGDYAQVTTIDCEKGSLRVVRASSHRPRAGRVTQRAWPSNGHQRHGIDLVPIAYYTLIDKGLKTVQVFRSQGQVL